MYGVAYHTPGNDGAGYFSGVIFSDPKVLRSPGFVYAGVPVGSTSLLSQGEYRPRLMLANFGATDAIVTVQYSSTSEGKTRSSTIANLVVPAMATKTTEFSKLMGDPYLQNSFIVRADATPGVVLSKLVSVGDGQLYEVEVIGKDEKQLENTGNHPWSVENGVESTLLLFNHAPTSQIFFVKVGGNAAPWRRDYTLAPLETKAISINELIANGAKDDRGKSIAKNAVRGEVVWLVPQSSLVTGRILQADRLLAMARNFSCGTCGFLCHDLGLSPYSGLSTFIGSQGNLGNISPQFCDMPCQVYTSCPAYSNPTTSGTTYYSWSGGGTIASLVSGGSSQMSTWRGAAVGYTNVNYSMSMGQGSYQCTGNGSVAVAPTISGPSTVWWFNGQNPNGASYPTSVTLTSSAGSSTTWSVTQTDSKVQISPSTGSSITVSSTGTKFSGAVGDVSIKATANGQTSAAFKVTVRTPWKLSLIDRSTVCDPTYVYITDIKYNVVDNLSSNIRVCLTTRSEKSTLQHTVDSRQLLTSNAPDDFENIAIGGNTPLVDPQAGLAFNLEGCDPQQSAIPPAPSLASAWRAAEAVEDYWMALLRDVPFSEYGTHSLAAAATKELNRISDFRGPKQNGQVTPETLFRGFTRGDQVGPYVSQFLLQPVRFGGLEIEQRYLTAPAESDYLSEPLLWLAVQNGQGPFAPGAKDGKPRFIRNGRDLSAYVHTGGPVQPYLTAAAWLLNNGVPFNEGNPYNQSLTQSGFVTFGAPHLFSLIGQVANCALKAIWYQKWYVHRTLRPEAYGGLVHWTMVKKANYPIHEQVLKSEAVDRLFRKHGTYFLPLAYVEGCPQHPSYAQGHAAVAGACVTILKAFFNTNFMAFPYPIQASSDGLSLVPYRGSDSDAMTLTNELHKLAGNISLGRNFAGIHWRSDYEEALLLGETVAISLLRDQKLTFNEKFQGFKLTKFDGSGMIV